MSKKKIVVGSVIVALATVFYATIGKYFIGSIVVITKPISGIVIDKETGKPIEGAYVDCRWDGGSCFRAIDSGAFVTVAQKTVRTNKDGKFYFPRLFRNGFFIYGWDVWVEELFAYVTGYKSSSSWEKPKLKGLKNVRLELESIKSIEEFAEECGDRGSWISESMKKFLIEEGKRFLELYPNSKCALIVHYHLAWRYAEMNDYNSALKEFEKIVELYSEKLAPEDMNKYINTSKRLIEEIKKYGKIKLIEENKNY